jgi:hypothetical protein
MFNKINGHLKINKEVTLYQGYTFSDFKSTNLYNGQDGIRIINLGEQKVGGDNYIVNLFFRENLLYMVSLVNCDIEVSELDEKMRKQIHDATLRKCEIEEGYQYSWGKIYSEYDKRSNVSSINIFYKN